MKSPDKFIFLGNDYTALKYRGSIPTKNEESKISMQKRKMYDIHPKQKQNLPLSNGGDFFRARSVVTKRTSAYEFGPLTDHIQPQH